MNLAGLSADQTPSVEAPLVVFRRMPALLALAGPLLTWQGDHVLLSRWTPSTLATTRLPVFGSIAPLMSGALLKVSPVSLATLYPKPLMIARLTASGLSIGRPLLCIGFLSRKPAYSSQAVRKGFSPESLVYAWFIGDVATDLPFAYAWPRSLLAACSPIR